MGSGGFRPLQEAIEVWLEVPKVLVLFVDGPLLDLGLVFCRELVGFASDDPGLVVYADMGGHVDDFRNPWEWELGVPD